MKRLVIIILFLLFAVAAKAQIAIDTLSAEALNELLIEQVERMAEDSDDDIDYEELLDYYIFLSDNPINLNSSPTSPSMRASSLPSRALPPIWYGPLFRRCYAVFLQVSLP